jgi:hypothetical protein
MKKRNFEHREEDYLINTKITPYLDNGSKNSYPIDNVLCKVYLPVKVTDTIWLVFHLSKEQYKIFSIEKFWRFAIESIDDTHEYYTPEHKTKISAENVYINHLNSKHWSFAISDDQMIAQPTDLKIEHFRSPDGTDIPKTFGRFWLTPNKLISPGQSLSASYTGDVKVKTVWKVDFILEGGLPITFSKRYRYRDGEENENISWSELVAVYELEGKAQNFDDVNNSLTDLDDLLRISSLALRHSCVCVGFDISNTEGYILDFYRRNISIPSSKKNEYDELIDIQHIVEFLNVTYRKFIEIERNDLVRQAINYTIPREGRTIENSFISLYSALETLILYFRKNADLEFVFTQEENEQWKSFDRILRQLFKRHPLLKNDKTKRKRLYDNIPALKRISFRAAFEECFKFYDVNIDDLWAVTGNSGGWSLSTIRNKLVHGEHFDSARRHLIVAAKSHLQWIVERLLLKILGWDISKSNVSSDYLARTITDYKDWKSNQKLLST